jgi:hypothetical protein
MKVSKIVAIGALAALVCGGAGAIAAGSFSTLPQIGGASYCATTLTGAGGLSGITGAGQSTVGSICAQTVPAGPTTFAGTEYFPVDIYALGAATQVGGPQTAVVSLGQLGQGPMVDLTTVAVSQTIAANSPWLFLDGAQGSAFTVTMPAVAIEGAIQHIVCEAATVGALTVAANAGQTVKLSPGVACVAGVTYNWRYQASNSTWYRF